MFGASASKESLADPHIKLIMFKAPYILFALRLVIGAIPTKTESYDSNSSFVMSILGSVHTTSCPASNNAEYMAQEKLRFRRFDFNEDCGAVIPVSKIFDI